MSPASSTDRSLGHVFLSHAGADTQAAREFAEVLRQNGLAVWLDRDSLLPGERWMEQCEEAIRGASAMIVYVGRRGVQNWVDREVRLGLERNTQDPRGFHLIPVLGEGSDPARLPPFLWQQQCADLRDTERAPEEIRRILEVLKQTSRAAIAADYWKEHSPFRSLRTFEPEDSWLFFGRDSDTDQLLVQLGRHALLAVTGNSGSGKSSLVRAGLVPALHHGRFQCDGSYVSSWRVAVFRPSAKPFQALAEALPDLAPELSPDEVEKSIARWKENLPENPEGLRNAIVALKAKSPPGTWPSGTRVLLVADQFEELFTLADDRETHKRYIDALLAAAQLEPSLAVHVVLTLGADFFSHCLEHPVLSQQLAANLVTVQRMSPDQLRRAIESRLALAGARAEAGLLDSILTDAGEEPGNLALLEHALGRLWEEHGGPGCTLTSDAYTAIGRLRGALGRHADRVYEGFSKQGHGPLTQRIFLELVQLGEGAQDTRRRVPKQTLLQLDRPEKVEAILASLASTRLISTEGRGVASPEESFVEVSHEALIREWPQLRSWLKEQREDLSLERRLVERADEWRSLGKDPGALLQGALLAQAEEWFGKHPDARTLVSEFVQASRRARDEAAQEQRERQERELASEQELRREAERREQAEKAAAAQAQRSARRTRLFSAALVAVLAIAIVMALLARRQQLRAESMALAVQAESLVSQGKREEALDLAIRAFGRAKTAEAHTAISHAFPQPVARLEGHSGHVLHAVFSPDGRWIVTASSDKTARVWNAATGELLAKLEGHSGEVKHAEFSPDGQRIVTVSTDETARVWNAATGKLVAKLEGHSRLVTDAAFSPDGQWIVTASTDETARVWNAATGQPVLKLGGHSGAVGHAAFSPDGQRVVTVSWDETARVWSATSGELVAKLEGHSGPVGPAVFSPDSQRIVTGSTDETARVWNAATGELLAKLEGHSGEVKHAEFSPDGQRIVTVSTDETARVWNAASGQLVAKLQGHSGQVGHAVFSPDGQWIVTASADETARVWNAASGRLVAKLQGYSGQVWHAAFSPDGQRIITAHADATALVWSAAGGQLVAKLEGHSGPVVRAAFSPDSQRIVTVGMMDSTAHVWNAATGKLVAKLEGHSRSVTEAAFSPDGQRIVTGSADKTARVWNAASGQLVAKIEGHSGAVGHAAFSPDGRRILTASSDKTARVWNAAAGQLVAKLEGHSGAVRHAAFSPDGQRIVTASTHKTARVWNAATGQLVAKLQGHSGEVMRAAFSPDGQRIVTASEDRTARVWNAATGQPVAKLQGHSDTVLDAAFSPDGQRIVTASVDKTARVWNAATGQQVAKLEGHSDAVKQAEFSPDGQRIVTVSSDETARVWNAATGQLVANLEGHSGWVMHAAFSPDGQRIATASMDGTVRVYRILTLADIADLLKN
jgi:WD40 repeat protein/energy-coupling factor transporter ATP-binding protein EcfA2